MGVQYMITHVWANFQSLVNFVNIMTRNAFNIPRYKYVFLSVRFDYTRGIADASLSISIETRSVEIDMLKRASDAPRVGESD